MQYPITPYLTISTVDIVAGVRRAIEKLPPRLPKLESDASSIAELLGVTIHSHEILYKAKTIFPFSLFPDTIIIDKEKLTIVVRYFFWVAKITSVPIRDILSVEADVGPFFGSIHLTSRYFFTNPHSINFLRRYDTLKIQKLLQGYIIANERDIDCSAIDRAQLEELLEHLGETN